MQPPGPVAAPPLVDLDQVPGAFAWLEGYHRPDWPVIWRKIEELPRDDWHDAMRDIGRQWLARLAADLGGKYRVCESAGFLLLTEQAPEVARDFLKFCEGAEMRIEELLGHAAMRDYYGKDVVLLFTESDDYYQYIAYAYGEGTHAQSGGISISDGYIHIAMPNDESSNRRVLAHELMHNNLAHLPIPAWLHEGLARFAETTLTDARFDNAFDEIDEHRETWSDDTIQAFWAGASFSDPNLQRQSYALAATLVQMLATERNRFIEFVRHADWRDAGQSAAVDILGCDLGEVVAPLTHAELCRPDRRAIAQWSSPPEGSK